MKSVQSNAQSRIESLPGTSREFSHLDGIANARVFELLWWYPGVKQKTNTDRNFYGLT